MACTPGPLNLITDVQGLLVGNADDAAARTGVSVILAERPAVCAVDVRGGGPGTRETDLLAAETLVEAVDALFLSGGSVYGLAAGDGVAAALGSQGRGYRLAATAAPPAPIVPGAILFDLANGGDKDWGGEPPYRRLGREALGAAATDFALGSRGAGAGAVAGTLKGGLGSASLEDGTGVTVGALAAVNSFGSVLMPGTDVFWAWPFEQSGEFGGRLPDPPQRVGPDDWGGSKGAALMRQNTTIAVVATNLALTPGQAKRLAIMAQDGLARSVRPVHALFDGDVVFALSTGTMPLDGPEAFVLSRLGERAANCLARAIARGVFEATSWPGGPPAYRDPR
jgi:L-aminopeptidase/D-esterase-like protein